MRRVFGIGSDSLSSEGPDCTDDWKVWFDSLSSEMTVIPGEGWLWTIEYCCLFGSNW